MKLTELTIEIKYKDILERYNYDWDEISQYEYFSEEFIKYYKDKLNWNYISTYQILSEKFGMIDLFKYIKNEINCICIISTNII